MIIPVTWVVLLADVEVPRTLGREFNVGTNNQVNQGLKTLGSLRLQRLLWVPKGPCPRIYRSGSDAKSFSFYKNTAKNFFSTFVKVSGEPGFANMSAKVCVFYAL